MTAQEYIAMVKANTTRSSGNASHFFIANEFITNGKVSSKQLRENGIKRNTSAHALKWLSERGFKIEIRKVGRLREYHYEGFEEGVEQLMTFKGANLWKFALSI